MTHTGHIVAESTVATMMAAVVVVVRTKVVIMVVMMIVRWVITVVPIGIVVGSVPIIVPIRIPPPIGSPIGTIAKAYVNTRVEIPIEGVVAVHINVCAAATGVVVVIIVSRRRGLRAKTLDTSGKLGIVIGLGGGVHNAVGVGHRLRGLVDRIGIADVVLTVGIVGLVVIFRIAADAGAHV